MDYVQFKEAIKDLRVKHRAFLTVLFFSGCRVSEALALTSNDVHCMKDTIFIQFKRLKGSKQTDPTEIPKADALLWLCQNEGKFFKFSRVTAWRIVKRVFPQLYPHYFRMNRITKTVISFGDATAYHVFGITANAIDHYRGKVDVKRMGAALRKETEV